MKKLFNFQMISNMKITVKTVVPFSGIDGINDY